MSWFLSDDGTSSTIFFAPNTSPSNSVTSVLPEPTARAAKSPHPRSASVNIAICVGHKPAAPEAQTGQRGYFAHGPGFVT